MNTSNNPFIPFVKIFFVLIFLTTLTNAAQAQRCINRFIDKFYEKEDVSTIELGGTLLSMASNMGDDDDAAKILASVYRLQVMIMEEKNYVTNSDLNQLKRDVQNNGFDELMMVRSGKERVNFFIKEKKGTITNVLVVISSEDGFVLLHIKGKLKFEDLRKLDFDVNGSDTLKKIPTRKSDVPRA